MTVRASCAMLLKAALCIGFCKCVSNDAPPCQAGGKQYKVSEGDVIYVEKLGVEDGATVSFDEVLVVGEGDSITVGAPYVSGAVVTGTVEKTGKGKKINIFKMKPKKGYRRRQGHRQPYTKVTIASIKA